MLFVLTGNNCYFCRYTSILFKKHSRLSGYLTYVSINNYSVVSTIMKMFLRPA